MWFFPVSTIPQWQVHWVQILMNSFLWMPSYTLLARIWRLIISFRGVCPCRFRYWITSLWRMHVCWCEPRLSSVGGGFPPKNIVDRTELWAADTEIPPKMLFLLRWIDPCAGTNPNVCVCPTAGLLIRSHATQMQIQIAFPLLMDLEQIQIPMFLFLAQLVCIRMLVWIHMFFLSRCRWRGCFAIYRRRWRGCFLWYGSFPDRCPLWKKVQTSCFSWWIPGPGLMNDLDNIKSFRKYCEVPLFQIWMGMLQPLWSAPVKKHNPKHPTHFFCWLVGASIQRINPKR